MTSDTAEPTAHAYRAMVEDLRGPDPGTYFRDAGASAGFGWALFAVAATADAWPLRLAAFCASTLLLYRALAFIHEIFHQQSMRGFRHFWHAVAGIPLLLPLLLYLPVHQLHHNARHYGTVADGEYERFQGRAGLMTAKLLGLNLLLPLALFVRFGLLTPLSVVLPALRTRMIPEFVHLSMRMPYRAPDITGPLRGESMRVEWLCFAFCMGGVALLVAGQAHWVAAWAATLVAVATLNTVRAICSTHLYVEHGSGRDTLGQLADSLNIGGGGLLTRLLCPTGLQFHALHHVAPFVPYHALPEAHRRLMAASPAGSTYHRATVGSLAEGWRRLVESTRHADAGGFVPPATLPER